LLISDGGKGLPEGLETKRTGLGMRLVRAFLAQIKATLTVQHDRGVSYAISIPSTNS
jgi:two-component sensor histidine kinase